MLHCTPRSARPISPLDPSAPSRPSTSPPFPLQVGRKSVQARPSPSTLPKRTKSAAQALPPDQDSSPSNPRILLPLSLDTKSFLSLVAPASFLSIINRSRKHTFLINHSNCHGKAPSWTRRFLPTPRYAAPLHLEDNSSSRSHLRLGTSADEIVITQGWIIETFANDYKINRNLFPLRRRLRGLRGRPIHRTPRRNQPTTRCPVYSAESRETLSVQSLVILLPRIHFRIRLR